VNAIRSSDHANCRCRAGVTLRPRWSGGTGWASRALRPWWSAFAGGSNWALATGLPLRTLRSDWSRRSQRASRPLLPDGALRTDRSLLALRPLRASRTNWAERASLARRTGRTLRSGASRQRHYRDGSSNGHQLSHQPLPVRGRRGDARAAATKTRACCTEAHKSAAPLFFKFALLAFPNLGAREPGPRRHGRVRRHKRRTMRRQPRAAPPRPP
jgi:hypothetical protein